MPFFAIFLGGALVLLGLGGYGATGMVSWTALIPAFFGVPVCALGLLALRPSWRTRCIYSAVALAILGLLGSARGVPNTITLLTGREIERPGAAISQAVMAVLCFAFVIAAIASLFDSRRRKRTPEPSA